jgi:hypothetical protein
VRRLFGTVLAAAVAVAGSACSRSGDPPDPTPSRCEVDLAVPEGFRVTGSMEDPYPDRIGVRIDLRADGGRELHYFAGIPGEFGEGLPEHGSVDIRGGETGVLLGDRTVHAGRRHRKRHRPASVHGAARKRRRVARSVNDALPHAPVARERRPLLPFGRCSAGIPSSRCSRW